MDLSDFFKKFPRLARAAALEDGRLPPPVQSKPSRREQRLAGLDDTALSDLAKNLIHKDEDLALLAVSRITGQIKLQMLAIDPDLDALLRIAALRRTADENTLALIARSDHEHAVAFYAATRLKSRDLILTLLDSVHEAVRIHARLALTNLSAA